MTGGIPSGLILKLYNEIPQQVYPLGVEKQYFADYLVPRIQAYQVHLPEIVRETVTQLLGEYARIRHEKGI